MVWCDVMWGDVVWCGVMWCGVGGEIDEDVYEDYSVGGICRGMRWLSVMGKRGLRCVVGKRGCDVLVE